MNKLITILFFCFMILESNSFADGFSVDGTRLIDANGNEFVMRGVNYAYTWFTQTMNQSLPAIANANANTVRIVLSNGDQWNKTSAQEVTSLINKCSELEMIAVLEVHDATGKDDEQSLIKAANYFVGLKDVISGKEDRVIVNIANEWYGSWDTNPWVSGYKNAIKAIRDAGLTHTIMVDCAGYGQYPKSLHDGGLEVFNSDPLANTMFAIHMYEYAGSDAQTIKSNIDKTLNKGLALCIGEFGFKHSNGDVDEQYILDYCKEKNVGWLAWSWHGNSGGVEYLDLANDASGSGLSDWGNTIVNGRNGLKETSRTCSIFEEVQQNQPPVVSITSPSGGEKFDAPASIEITVNASDPDGNVTKVEFYNESTKIGEAASRPFTFTWDNVDEGTYKICARAYDNKGEPSISDTVTVVVEYTNNIKNSKLSESKNKDNQIVELYDLKGRILYRSSLRKYNSISSQLLPQGTIIMKIINGGRTVQRSSILFGH